MLVVRHIQTAWDRFLLEGVASFQFQGGKVYFGITEVATFWKGRGGGGVGMEGFQYLVLLFLALAIPVEGSSIRCCYF